MTVIHKSLDIGMWAVSSNILNKQSVNRSTEDPDKRNIANQDNKFNFYNYVAKIK